MIGSIQGGIAYKLIVAPSMYLQACKQSDLLHVWPVNWAPVPTAHHSGRDLNLPGPGPPGIGLQVLDQHAEYVKCGCGSALVRADIEQLQHLGSEL